MDITENKVKDVIILELNGRLDTTNYGILEKKLEDLCNNNHKEILLNLDKMDYISSSGLRVFLMYLKKLKSGDGKLMLSNMQDNVKEIFDIAGFTSIFEIFENAADAVK